MLHSLCLIIEFRFHLLVAVTKLKITPIHLSDLIARTTLRFLSQLQAVAFGYFLDTLIF
jgi:hypothetical protein